MSQDQKLQQEEIDSIKMIQSQKIKLNEELAAITLAEFELKTRKQAAENFYNSLKEAEKSIAAELQTKYGFQKVHLNLETGDITEA
jgi:oligoendopeptidase F